MQAALIASFLGLFPGIGTQELLIVLFVILLLFGAKKLPELARGVGRSLREFRKASSEIEDDLRSAVDTGEKETPAQSTGKAVPAPERKEVDSASGEKESS
jgi:sec-independent protein translocase protein TatA